MSRVGVEQDAVADAPLTDARSGSQLDERHRHVEPCPRVPHDARGCRFTVQGSARPAFAGAWTIVRHAGPHLRRRDFRERLRRGSRRSSSVPGGRTPRCAACGDATRAAGEVDRPHRWPRAPWARLPHSAAARAAARSSACPRLRNAIAGALARHDRNELRAAAQRSSFVGRSPRDPAISGRAGLLRPAVPPLPRVRRRPVQARRGAPRSSSARAGYGRTSPAPRSDAAD